MNTCSVSCVPGTAIVHDVSGQSFEVPVMLHSLQGVCSQAIAYCYSGGVVTVRYYPLVGR